MVEESGHSIDALLAGWTAGNHNTLAAWNVFHEVREVVSPYLRLQRVEQVCFLHAPTLPVDDGADNLVQQT